MLYGLYIKNMVLIDDLEINFKSGLNVLTGETGAGKSILLDCLGFVMGWRGRSDLVRSGAKQGEVTACFELPLTHPALDILEQSDLLEEGQELILRRVNMADGRKNAYVNGRRCSNELLRQLSETLLEIHGQNHNKGLLNPRDHKKFLDEFAQIELSNLRKKWMTCIEIQNQLSSEKIAQEQTLKDQDYLRHALDELEKIAPQVGEEEVLDEKRRLMKSSKKTRQDIEKAAQILSREGIEVSIYDVSHWIEQANIALGGRLNKASEHLEKMRDELAETQQCIEVCLRDLSFDPLELESIEERLFALRGLARKHSVLVDDLPALAIEFSHKIQSFHASADRVEQLTKDLNNAQAIYTKEAEEISAARHQAAERLKQAMRSELPPLKLENAEFMIEITNSEPSRDGIDHVEFMVTTNPGSLPGPINKIASGGELSRFLLALKVCLTHHSDDLTMIFDEIDSGIGGATADAVGLRLSAISKKTQVLVVTHSPQVAAKGDYHFLVTKEVNKGHTFSKVTALDNSSRIDEIARMLSGVDITDAARFAAVSLLR